MNILKRKLTVAGGLVFAFLLLCYTATHFIIRADGFRTWVQSELSRRTGYEVRIAELRLSPGLSLLASGILVSKKGEVLFQGKRVVCSFSPFDFYYGRIHRLSLENPVFHLSLQDLFQPSGKVSTKISIGTLNINQGEIVLKTGYGEPVTLRSIVLSGNNVDFGGETGLHLRAYVPELNANAAFSLSGGPIERKLQLFLDQGQDKALTRKEHGSLQAGFQMKEKENATYEVKGSAIFNRFRLGAGTIQGQLDSLLEVDAKLTELLFSINLAMPRFPAKLLPAGVPVFSGSVRGTLAGQYSVPRKALTLQQIKLAFGIGTVDGVGSVALGEKPASLKSTLRLRDVTIDSLKPFMPKALGGFSYAGKLAADLTVSGAYNAPTVAGLAWYDGAQVRGEKFSISELSLKVPFQWARSSFRVKGGQLQGKGLTLGREGETQVRLEQVSLVGDAEKKSAQPLQATAEFQIGEGKFSTPDGSKVGEHLAAEGQFTYQDGNEGPSFEGSARIKSLELLWNKFFGDFKDQKPSIEVKGTYQKDTDKLLFDRLHLALGSISDVELKGWVQHVMAAPRFGLEVRTDDFRPAGFYDFFIRDTFKASYPVLGNIALAGAGELAIRAEGSLESFEVNGNLRMRQGEIREKSDRWHIGPLALDLPIKLHFPQAATGSPGETPPMGELSIEEVKTPSVTIPEIRTSLSLWNDALRFPQPIRISLFGGEGVINGLAWRDVIGAPRDLSFSLGLNNLKLQVLTQALGWYKFGGTLSGNIPEVRWAGDSLKSSGAIILNVFGGRVTIRGMEIENPLSPLRSIRMDASLEDLNLEQASETFQFGRISGILAGAIRDLVITQGQPAQFEADIHSVEKSGVSQWISVEALNKIIVLSSGSEAGAIYGGIAGLFNFFRYSKLGFKATLKNDTLVLHGVESNNGNEYLVVGSLLPPTVNIISHTEEIGFSELLRRLERIQRSGSPKSSGHS